jgi:MurNAc alpha-1-phosphate uridylyltransferase
MTDRGNPISINEVSSEAGAGVFPVVILAGGLATRLRPITETIPKCLVEINGVPFIDIQLRQLANQGVSKVVVLIGYLGEMVGEHVGDGSRYGLEVVFVPDGPNLLGTAGALRAALDHLPETFFVLYGDSYLRCPYQAIQERLIESGQPVLMTVFKNNRQWDTSNVKFVGGRVAAYSKRKLTAEMDHIDYGLMVFKREIIEVLPPNQVLDLATVLEEQVNRGKVVGFEVVDRFYEIGSHDGLRDLSEYLAAVKSPEGSPSREDRA